MNRFHVLRLMLVTTSVVTLVATGVSCQSSSKPLGIGNPDECPSTSPADARVDTSPIDAGTSLVERMHPSQFEGLRECFIAGPTLQRPRFGGHAAVVLQDGSVLVSGGFSLTNDKDTLTAFTELLAPGAESWRVTTPMLEKRGGHAAVTLRDGRVLAIGGVEMISYDTIYGPQYGPKDSVEIYDPSTERWTRAAPMHSVRTGSAAAVLDDGRVLVVGGGDIAAEAYSPDDDSWEALPHPTWQGLEYVRMERLSDGRYLIVIGGTPEVTIFDPATKTWTAGPRLDFFSVPILGRLGDEVVLFDSNPVTGDGPHVFRLDHWETFPKPAGMMPRSARRGAQFRSGYLVIGGFPNTYDWPTVALASADVYTIVAGEIQRHPAGRLRFPQAAPGAVTLNSGQVLVIGGNSPYQYRVGETEVFTGDCSSLKDVL